MTNISTGKAFTRRDFGKGLAAIFAAGVAPALLGQTARGLMHRNLGGRIATGGGKTFDNPYDLGDGSLVAMWDKEFSRSISTTKKIVDVINGISLDVLSDGDIIFGSDFIDTNGNWLMCQSQLFGNLGNNYTVEYAINSENDSYGTTPFYFSNARIGYGNGDSIFNSYVKRWSNTAIEVGTGINNIVSSRSSLTTNNSNGCTLSYKRSGIDYCLLRDSVVMENGSGTTSTNLTFTQIRLGYTRTVPSSEIRKAYVYNIRVYSKSLSNNDLEKTHNVDKERFGTT